MTPDTEKAAGGRELSAPDGACIPNPYANCRCTTRLFQYISHTVLSTAMGCIVLETVWIFWRWLHVR
jgi:hypothetical protein